MKSILLGIALLPMVLALSFERAEARVHRGFACESTDDDFNKSCFDVACELVGGYRFCSSSDAVSQIEQACLSNINGSCLANSCQWICIRFCSSVDDVREAAYSCQGTCVNSCVNEGCARLGCNNLEKVTGVNLACSGHVSGQCVKEKCTSSGCRNLTDFTEASRACGGQW